MRFDFLTMVVVYFWNSEGAQEKNTELIQSNFIVILEVATLGGTTLQQAINIEGFYVLH